MISDPALREALVEAAETYPYPLAVACRDVLDTDPRDNWHEWELLSRDALTPVLTYLSHLLLSDLVATGREPAHLFHRIEAILSRPLAGHYVGFLRETARYYREEDVESTVPELVEFLVEAEVDQTLSEAGRPLLGQLVDYRNRWAHGRIENEEVVERNLQAIRRLTRRLLVETSFLAELPVTLEDGTELMGSSLNLPEEPLPLVTVAVETPSDEGVSLRPLLLKLDGRELSLLAEADLRGRRLTYRSPSSYTQFDGDDLENGSGGAQLFEELKSLLREVRSLEATLPRPDRDSFRRRTAVETDRMLDLYGKTNLGKYDPALYVPRPTWEAEEGRFWTFLDSEKSLLAIDGEQGTGKSALAARLAERSQERGHAVWFLNGQRFTFADVSWSDNPYPRYFADRLSYEAPFDAEAIKALAQETDEDERIVLFVDGINEIDAISNKWNRFKAITLLLEWIQSVAHPTFKVVLTFRTEAYTRFDYLKSEDLPEDLESVSYLAPASENPKEHPWVHTLSPFTEAQAEQLYNRLQGLQRGMTPNMTWETVRESLGADLETFITNPLLFTVFLRAHDGQSEVISTDQDELFTQYVNGVTGARERQQWPGWKQAYHFLKNGNITEKERFLADCVEKASETGTPSFLESDLAPQASDRDHRIQRTLTDPEREEQLEHLQESGLITREPIREIEGEGAENRLSFTSELLTRAVGRIGKTVRRRTQAVNALLIGVYGVAVLTLAPLFGYLILSSAFAGGTWEGGNLIRAVIIDMVIHSSPLLLILLACYAYVYLPGTTHSVTPRRLGLVEYSLYRRLENDELHVVRKALGIVLPGFALTALLYGFDTLVFETGLFVPLYYSAAVNTLFLVLCVLPHLTNYVIRGRLDHPLRIKHRLLDSITTSLRALSYRVPLRGTMVLLGVVLAGLALSYDLSNYYFLPHEQGGFQSTQEVVASQISYSVFVRSASRSEYWFSVSLVASGFMVALVVLTPYLSLSFARLSYRVYRDFVGRPTYSPALLPYALLPAYVGLLLLGASDGIPEADPLDALRPSPDDSTTVVSQHPELKPHVSDPEAGKLVIDLRGAADLSDSAWTALRSTPIQRLTIPSSLLRQTNLTGWTYVGQLVVTGDTASLAPRHASPRLNALEVRGHLNGLSHLSALYPLLGTLSVTEASVQAAGGLPSLWEDALIHIRSNGPPDLHWLRSRSSSYIFNFSHPPDRSTKNLSLLHHVAAPGPDFDPALLRKMPNLSWLYLTNSPCEQDTIPKGRQAWCAKWDRIESRRSLNIDHSSDEEPLISRRTSTIATNV